MGSEGKSGDIDDFKFIELKPFDFRKDKIDLRESRKRRRENSKLLKKLDEELERLEKEFFEIIKS